MAKSSRNTVRTYGVNACLALARSRPADIDRAWVTEESRPLARELLRTLAGRRRPYRVISGDEMARVAGARHHEGVCVEARPPPAPSPQDLVNRVSRDRDAVRLVYLDGVENPHNLGAVVRTCAHFGVAAVLGAEGEIPALGGAAVRVAQGGAEHVPVIPAKNPARLLADLADAGVDTIATDASAREDLYASELPPRCAFILGAERTGVSPRVRRAARRAVSIPGTGVVESLNVSAACAVVLAEHFRRTR